MDHLEGKASKQAAHAPTQMDSTHPTTRPGGNSQVFRIYLVGII